MSGESDKPKTSSSNPNIRSEFYSMTQSTVNGVTTRKSVGVRRDNDNWYKLNDQGTWQNTSKEDGLATLDNYHKEQQQPVPLVENSKDQPSHQNSQNSENLFNSEQHNDHARSYDPFSEYQYLMREMMYPFESLSRRRFFDRFWHDPFYDWNYRHFNRPSFWW